MGVRGLQSYIEHNCPNAFQPVSLIEMVAEYRKLHPNVQEPVIVVDGLNCMQWWYKNLDWVCGGQWLEFLHVLQRFVDAFAKIGVKLVFFFDCLTTITKEQQWITRRLKNLQDAKQCFEQIHQKSPIASDMYFQPASLSQVVRIALKQVRGTTVYANVSGECDRIIASYAALYHCMAILAQDTDYVIYESVPYLSIQHLDLRIMKTMKYCRDAFCRSIGLQPSLLPLFACLLGNDCILRDNLNAFHHLIFHSFNRNAVPRHYSNLLISKIIPCLTKYITTLQLSRDQNTMFRMLPKIWQDVFRGQFPFEEFRKAVETYTLNFAATNLYPYPGITQQSSKMENRRGIYEVLVRKTINVEIMPLILDILSFGKREYGSSLEDESSAEFLPRVIVYRPIHCRLYTLIFKLRDNYLGNMTTLPHTESPIHASNTVEEYWVSSSPGHICPDITYPLPLNLPDDEVENVLYQFLMCTHDDRSSTLACKKWQVMSECIGLTISTATLQRIPNQFKTLCIVLNYLIQHPDVPIKCWEVDAFLAQAVHPMAKDVAWHSSLKLQTYIGRAVHLASLFCRGIGTVLDVLTVCGNPYSLEHCMPWNFFDGKRFHYCYTELSKRMDVPKLFQYQVSCLEEFNHLKNATLEGINLS